MAYGGTASGAAVSSPGGRKGALRALSLPQAGAVLFGAVDLALVVGTLVFGSASHIGGPAGGGLVCVAVGSLVVGVLLAVKRPDNAMGWCLLGACLFLGFAGVGGSVAVLDFRMHHAIPLGSVAVVLQPSWAPAIVCLGLSFLLFPDGHFSSRTVRWLTWFVLAVGVVWMAGAFAIAVHAVVTHTVRMDHTGNLLAIDHPRGSWAWWGDVENIFFPVLGLSWVLWLVLQVPRYRKASDEKRHQMKWLLSGTVVALVGGVLALVPGNTANWVAGAGVAALTALPVSIAIGATKFHLYSIDRLISRTLSYVLLTGVVVGVYAGVVTLATKVIGFSSPVAVAASTLVAAALFNPVRKRLQRGVDRRFNRARYDAEQTVSDFAARLRESVDPGTVSDDLINVVHAVFEPGAATVWIRQGSG